MAPPAPPPLADDAAEPAPAWRERGERYITEAEVALWSDAGTPARQLLSERGLTDETMRRWRLGYQPSDAYEDPSVWGLEGKRIWLPRGIVIPWHMDGQLWQVKFRRPDPSDPKYISVRGGTPVLYGADTLAAHDVIVLPEGELDAVLLEQHCGDLVGVATLGSASRRPDALAADHLLGARVILTLCDSDTAGERGADRLAGLMSRAIRVRVPVGKDATDFVKAGGDLRAWLSFELERLDLLSEELSPEPVIAITEPPVEAPPDTEPESRPWRGVRVRWGRERGDLAMQDPADGTWHEIAYRDATPAWRAAVKRRSE